MTWHNNPVYDDSCVTDISDFFIILIFNIRLASLKSSILAIAFNSHPKTRNQREGVYYNKA
jgi:hypothetical protein